MYFDQFFILRGCIVPDKGWDLLKFLSSPEGNLYYPIEANGSMPPRQSVAATAYIDFQMDEIGLSREQIQVFLDAATFMWNSESHLFVHWQEMWEKGIQPYFEEVFIGKASPAEAAAKMEEAVNRIIEETTPAE